MIKKTLLAALLAILLLVGVLLVRTAGMASRQGPTQGPVTLEVDADAAARRLAGAVRIPTISFERVEDTDSAAFRSLHAYFEESYPRVHQHLGREVVGGLSLLYTWQGSDPDLEPLVLMGHQDVVPVIPGTEGDWTHPPFGGALADGFVWGRGTMDDKVTVVSILEAVESLLGQGFAPRRTVYLAFGHDEEVGGVRGASAIADLLAARGAEPYALVLDEGGAVVRDLIPGIQGPVAMVGVAEKGYVSLELLVEGAGGHSSTPPAQTNIGILAEAISELEERPFPARLTAPVEGMMDFLAPELPFLARVPLANLWLFGPVVERVLSRDPAMSAMVRTTTAATIIEGGVKANVLPIRARAVVNHRILPGETTATVMARVGEVIDDPRIQVRVLGNDAKDPSPVSDPEGPAFDLIARTVRQVMAGEDVTVIPYLVVGGTDAKYYSGRSPAVFRFLPAVVGADALVLAHGTDERLSVESLEASIRFFRQLIHNADAAW